MDIGLVGGSDHKKILEQIGQETVNLSKYFFSENGLIAYKENQLIGRQVTLNLFTVNKSAFIITKPKKIHQLLSQVSRWHRHPRQKRHFHRIPNRNAQCVTNWKKLLAERTWWVRDLWQAAWSEEKVHQCIKRGVRWLEFNLLDWRTDIVRCDAARMGQDLLPEVLDGLWWDLFLWGQNTWRRKWFWDLWGDKTHWKSIFCYERAHINNWIVIKTLQLKSCLILSSFSLLLHILF